MALVITQRIGKPMRIGEAIVTLKRVSGGNVKVSIEAPQHVRVDRNTTDGHLGNNLDEVA